MFLLDLTHTSHTRARTGIQRVSRALHAALTTTGTAAAVTWDPYAHQWRTLDDWETQNLLSSAPSSHRGAHWPWSAQLRGHRRQWLRLPPTLPAAAEGLIIPELFSAQTAAALPGLMARAISGAVCAAKWR